MTLTIGNLERGFTITETIVALAIIAMVIGMGIPAFQNYSSINRMKITSGEIATTLRLARGYAISIRQECQVNFDIENSNFWLSATDSTGKENVLEKRHKLPPGVKIKSTTFLQNKATFTSLGSLKEHQGGSVTITDAKGRTKTISVIGPTGMVKIE